MTDRQRGGFTLEESARRLGNYRWVALQLFELLGTWAADVPETDVKLHLAAASRHHGWHAELFEERLPEVRELSPQRQTVAPNDEFAGLIGQLRSLDGPAVTVERLVGTYRVVVPHLVAVQSSHLDRCTPVADAAVARTLGFVLADEVADWRAAEGLLLGLVDADAVERAAAFRLDLERRLVASGGISGPSASVEHD